MNRAKHYSLFSMTLGLVALLTLFCSNPLYGQYLRPDWNYDYGGTRWEECNSFIETSGGNYIMAGYTGSDASGDITETTYDTYPSPDKGDFWVLVTDANGNKIVDRRYGGDRLDRLWSIEETDDGGFVMGGWSRSNVGNDKSEPSYGDLDYWILKVDENMDHVWDRTFGGTERDILYELIQTSDGGYLAVGTSESGISGMKDEPLRGEFDLWIIKIDSVGTLKWQKTIGGDEEERVNVVFEESDGNYVIGGSTESAVDGVDILETGYGGKDYWVIKIDSTDGSKFWEKRYGGSEEDEIQAMIPVSTGGYLLAGGSRSPANIGIKEFDSQSLDIWAVKVDDSGDVIEWERTLGGLEFDNCYSLKENTVGNFILGGYSQSDISATKTSPNRGLPGTSDYWINYLAPDGTQVWDQAFGGPESDVLEDIFQTSDGGYILAGHSRTDIGGDKTDGTEGLNDFWIIKTLCDVQVEFNDTIVCPNTDFVLDARDSNCVLCDWQWEDSSGDSLRTLNIENDQSFAVTLTDGVGCQWSDDVQVEVHAVEGLDLGPDVSICEGETYETGVVENPANIYNWNTGENSSLITIDSQATYLLNITDSNQCEVEDSLMLTVNPLPIVNLGNDTTLCFGQTIDLDAGNNHALVVWDPLEFGQILSVTPNAPINIGVTVGNVFNCTAQDAIQIDVVDLPAVTNLTTFCTDNNDEYIVTFSVDNFPVSELIVNGMLGSWNGNIFTSDTINQSLSYSFSVANAQECESQIYDGLGPCICYSEAGSIDQNEFNICENGTSVFTTSNTNLDQDDIVEYILHDGDVNTVGNILFTYSTLEIFNPGTLILGQTYYLAIQVGNSLGNSINPNDGCLSISQSVPVTFFENPTTTVTALAGQELNCDIQSLSLNGTASSGNGTLDFIWSSPLGNIIGSTTGPEIEVDEEAWYFLNITDNNGCSSLDSIYVDAEEGLPNIELTEPETLTCIDTVISISALGSSLGTEFSWSWIGAGINGSSDIDVEITQPGQYSLEIENTETGCVEVQTFDIDQNILVPNIDAGNNLTASCISEEGIQTAIIIDNCTDCDINWTTNDGSILEGSNQLNPLVDGLGWYYMQAINRLNGCIQVDSFELIPNTNIPQEIIYQAESPPCENDEFGELEVKQIIGGTPPFSFSLNGISYQNDVFFDNLIPGDYELMILDDQGCSLESSFNIPLPENVEVQLEQDFTITLGESIQLIPVYTPNVSSLSWEGPGTELCPECVTQDLIPTDITDYTVTVITDKGCEAQARITVFVKDDVQPYIPNAFSPNDDGNNDRFHPFFSEKYVQSIENFSIFNRWGALVWQESNASPEQLEGWNGKFRGKKVNPDVFIYSIDVILINGDYRNFSGDVTVFR